jgi:hypothetical protein
MAALLIIVIGLVVWSVRLMHGAIQLRDFSLILASTLVAISAAGVVAVYALMDGCMSSIIGSHPTVSVSEVSQAIPDILYEPEPPFSTSALNSQAFRNSQMLPRTIVE